VCELDLIAAGEETVEDGGDLALEHELAVDELNLLTGHLRGANTAALLLSVGRRPIMLRLVVFFVHGAFGELAEGVLRLVRETVLHRPVLADIRLGAEDIVRVSVEGD
jgi:hypothetical protein